MSFKALRSVLAVLAVVALFLGGFGLGRWTCKPADPLTPEERQESHDDAVDHGYVPPVVVDTPPVAYVPKHSRPTRVAEGEVAPSPRDPAPNAEESGLSPTPLTDPSPWPITSDLSGGCKYEEVDIGGVPYARLFWTGRLQGRDGSELLSRGPELVRDVKLTVAPPVAIPPKLRLDWLVGGSYGNSRAGLETGFSFANRKHGAYFLVEHIAAEGGPSYQSERAQNRVHGGYRRAWSF